MQRRIPSLEKIGRFINYSPKTLLNEIIEKVVESERSKQLQPATYEVVSTSHKGSQALVTAQISLSGSL